MVIVAFGAGVKMGQMAKDMALTTEPFKNSVFYQGLAEFEPGPMQASLKRIHGVSQFPQSVSQIGSSEPFLSPFLTERPR